MGLACGRAPADAAEDGASSSAAETSAAATGGSDASATTGDSGTSASSDSDVQEGSSETDDGDGSSSQGTDGPDMWDDHCGVDCDVWDPTSCQAGEKCTATSCWGSFDSNKCRVLVGEQQVGDECEYVGGFELTGHDNCAAGSICRDVDDQTGLGVCWAFCQGTPEEPSCPAASQCVIANAGVLPLCAPSCDPLAQDCPSNAQTCLPYGEGYSCVFSSSGGMAPYGTPCAYRVACDPGLVCADASEVPEASCTDAAHCCTPYCSLADSTPCPGVDQICKAVYDPQPPGFELVGTCGMP